MQIFDPSRSIVAHEYHVYERAEDDRKLVVVPEVPYWLVLDAIAFRLLQACDGTRSVNEIAQALAAQGVVVDYTDLCGYYQELLDIGVVSYCDALTSTAIPEETTVFTVKYLTCNVTLRCNLRCRHCYISAGTPLPDEMTTDELLAALDQIMPYHTGTILIEGGEPLTHPDIFEILEHVCAFGHKVYLVTNGLLLDSARVERIAAIANLAVQVSLDGATKGTHEALRGSNTFERTLEGIKRLCQAGVSVIMSPMVTLDMFDEIEQYLALAVEVGAQNVIFNPVIPVGEARRNGLERVNDRLVFEKVCDLYVREPAYRSLLPRSLEIKAACYLKGLVRFENCGTGCATLVLHPNGDLYPCPNLTLPEFKLGNLRETPFRTIWEDSPLLQILRQLRVGHSFGKKCARCEIRYFCGGGCRGLTYQITGDLGGLYPYCHFAQELFPAILWRLADCPELFDEEAEDFLRYLSKYHALS